MGKLRIRRALAADAATIAAIHVAAWRETYADLFPPEALALLDVAERAAFWRERLAAGPGEAVFLLSFADDAPCGFAASGPQRSERLAALGFPAELSALYILERGQRRGGGRALMAAMAAHLLARDWRSASVWVFRDNPPARRFYEAMGGVATGVDGSWTTLGVTRADMSYGWRDVASWTRRD
jgi:L-amino acid N-acyltransferase YncA